jgi:pyridoxamine 5'-phosphate oxidase
MDELLGIIWDHLVSGVNAGEKRSAFTMMQVATIGLNGLPGVRTVVMRRADRENSLLAFHTDLRSEKVREIEKEPHVGIVVGDWPAGIQIRLDGLARVVEDRNERLVIWNSSRPRTLTLYRVPLVPGTAIETPEDARPSSPTPGPLEGFENFCVVDVHIQKIDFLDVSGKTHRRAKFSLERGQWQATWVAP